MSNMNNVHSSYGKTAASTVRTFDVNRYAVPAARALLFAVLIAASTMAGTINIPGNPVPITLQTLALCLAGLSLTWRQAASSVIMYLTMGAVGLPVFAGGKNGLLAFAGPSVGYLIGFVFGVAAIALLKNMFVRVLDTLIVEETFVKTLTRFGAYLAASIVGTLVIYAFGFVGQSMITGVPLPLVALLGMGFVIGDTIKAVVASAACAGLHRVFARRKQNAE